MNPAAQPSSGLRVLYLTTELPYFPGQAGHLPLEIRHLAQAHEVGVVGPRYEHQPAASLENLRRTVAQAFWWPDPAAPGALPALPAAPAAPRWLPRLPRWLRLWWLHRLTGLHRHSDDALIWRAVLVNLSPQLLEAMTAAPWHAVLLSQSTSAVWLPFLPASLARCLYLHDIRSDYARRTPAPYRRRDLRRLRLEERQAVRAVDAIACVSELDQRRAETLLAPSVPPAVAPVCLDPGYFSFSPRPDDAPPMVLFTGHLGHPPNIDAVRFFLGSIWPLVTAVRPDARCRIVGLQPDPAVVAAAAAAGAELIPNAPDTRPHFHSARVYVVPMRFGGGVRQKIPEAWALGLPVVTTAMGAEGLAARDGENCWIRDRPEDFARQVANLLERPVPPAVLRAARATVETVHAPDVACPPLGRQLGVAVQRRQAAPPRVLFDLRWLQPGRVGGVEQMTQELIAGLAATDRTYNYHILCPPGMEPPGPFPRGFRHRIVRFEEESAHARRHGLIAGLAAGLGLPALTSPELRALEFYARLDFSVVHGLPCYVHPDLRRFPSVVTMHDLQHRHHPEFFSPEDIATREREYRESCRLAGHILCTSEFTRQDVHRQYGVPLEKMTVVWNLPPRVTGTIPAPADVRRLLAGMGVASPFLYYPAQPWRHKNHHGLFEAVRRADRELPPGLRLVLTGQPLPDDHPAAALLREPAVQRRVQHLGYRTPVEVAALYHAAEALVFPSLFEGFGMPVIEAMQQGCPVVCGHHSSLPEIAGEAALYTDVARPDALAESLVNIARDAGLRATLRARGTANLRRFDRRALVEKTRAVYAAVHERHFG